MLRLIRDERLPLLPVCAGRTLPAT